MEESMDLQDNLCDERMNVRGLCGVSSHFEYLKNRSRGLNVTFSQSEETLLRNGKQSLSREASQSAVRRR